MPKAPWVRDPGPPAHPALQGCPQWAWSRRSWLQGEQGDPVPLAGPGALGPRKAAHLAVAGARLVHEGAVLAGPHGGCGGVRGAPNGSELMGAWKGHADCACRPGREASVQHFCMAKKSSVHVRYSLWREMGAKSNIHRNGRTGLWDPPAVGTLLTHRALPIQLSAATHVVHPPAPLLYLPSYC